MGSTWLHLMMSTMMLTILSSVQKNVRIRLDVSDGPMLWAWIDVTSRMVLGRVMGLPIISVLTATLMLSLEFPVGTRNVHIPNYMKVASNE